MSKILSDIVFRCCDEVPEMFDFTFVSGCPMKSLFQCKNCGFHIHTNESFMKTISIWNRVIKEKFRE